MVRCQACKRSVEPVYRATGGTFCPVCHEALGSEGAPALERPKTARENEQEPELTGLRTANTATRQPPTSKPEQFKPDWTPTHMRLYRRIRFAYGVAVVQCVIGIIDIVVRDQTNGRGIFVGGRFTYLGFGLVSATCLLLGLVVRHRLRSAGHPLQAYHGTRAAWVGSIGVGIALIAAMLAPAAVADQILWADQWEKTVPGQESVKLNLHLDVPTVLHYESRFLPLVAARGNATGEVGLYLCIVPLAEVPNYALGNASDTFGCHLQTEWAESTSVELPRGDYALVASCLRSMPDACQWTVSITARQA